MDTGHIDWPDEAGRETESQEQGDWNMRAFLTQVFELRLWGLLALAVACSAAVPTPTVRPVPACLQGPSDHVDYLRIEIDMLFDPAEVDSADNAAHGIPYATGANVHIVTSDSLCTAVIAAHNSLPDSERIGTSPLTQAFVFDLNGTGFAMADTSMTILVMLKPDLSFFRAWAM
jgi:hypothetical protein